MSKSSYASPSLRPGYDGLVYDGIWKYTVGTCSESSPGPGPGPAAPGVRGLGGDLDPCHPDIEGFIFDIEGHFRYRKSISYEPLISKFCTFYIEAVRYRSCSISKVTNFDIEGQFSRSPISRIQNFDIE
jgi:hypothetical protein